MAIRHFVQVKLSNTNSGIVPVNAEGEYVYDFLVSIKKQFSKLLKSYESYELSLFEAGGSTIISNMDSIETLTEKKKPLVVLV